MFGSVSNIHRDYNYFMAKRRWKNRQDTSLFKLFNKVKYNYDILSKRYKDHDVETLGVPDEVKRLLKDYEKLNKRFIAFKDEVVKDNKDGTEQY